MFGDLPLPQDLSAVPSSFFEIRDSSLFRIDREIAKGGMGIVYEGRQIGAEGFEKTVAIKIILQEYTSDREFVEMFIGEAKLVADLIHENIVQIYQLGKVGTAYYIAMEYIEGTNIQEFVNRHAELGRPLPIELCAFIISRICRGLEYAHTKRDKEGRLLGVVHRDVSPGNILMTNGGVVKLGDFGIAKARNLMRDREGEVLLGKVRYMSPEQARFENTDGRSDIFSLGIVFWEVLAGQPLFEEEDTVTAIEAVTRRDIPPIKDMNPRVPDEVARILDRALERDLKRRYQTAAEMGYALEYFMYHNRFGPTNLSLHRYLKTLYPEIKVYIDPTVPDPYFDSLLHK